jgi:hypothetical protein
VKARGANFFSLFVISAMLALPCLCSFAFALPKYIDLKEHGEHAEGVIEDSKTVYVRGKPMTVPQVVFSTKAGEQCAFDESNASPISFSETVDVLYDPAECTRAIADPPITALFFGVLGMLSLGLSIYSLRRWRSAEQ